jgi:YfiH family protein
VLLYDAKLRAVCAIHAGWRGTVKRIVEKSLAALTATYGSRQEDVYAQICPGISLDSFEVGDEVFEAFQQEGFPMELISKRYPSDGVGNFSTFPSSLYPSKWHINLPECNRLQLLSCGVPEGHIHVSPICTYKQHDLFFSARRLGIHSGRIFSGIMIEENYK